MKAVQVDAFGGPEALHLVSIAVPKPAPGEALVRLHTAGVNYIDVYMRDGSYARSHTYKTPLPMTIGMEGVGTVVDVGDDIQAVRPGMRVGYCLSRGSYAEYAAVPASKLVEIPDGVPDEIATALMLQGSTAHYLTHSAFPLQSGQTCLVHAGAGGVGQLLIQLAKARGARVITTVGTPGKAEIARGLGADHTILYREQNFAEAVREVTGANGVEVVYDSVGRETLRKSLSCLGRRGTCINFGASSGQPEPIEVLELAESGSVFLTRPHLADYMATPEEIRGRAHDLFAAFLGGRLKVAIDGTLPLADAAKAHRRLEARETQGKQILAIGAAA